MTKRYEKYKDSGVDWIGDIPEYWEIKKFKHLYKSNMGATLLKIDLETDGMIPVYSATESDNIFGYVNESSVILDPDDLVIPARGNSIGYATMVKEKVTCTKGSLLIINHT
jgi:type I restriction enzyme S subunit